MTDQLSLKALQVVLVGEHLRNRLHAEEDPVMIKDRRYHLRMYSCCFVGRDLVDWLIRHGDASSRGGAVQCMNVLLDHGIIHHGKGNASEEGKSLVSCKLPVKLLCVCAHIFLLALIWIWRRNWKVRSKCKEDYCVVICDDILSFSFFMSRFQFKFTLLAFHVHLSRL